MTPPCPWLLGFHPGSSPENSGNSSKETLLLMVALIDSSVSCLGSGLMQRVSCNFSGLIQQIPALDKLPREKLSY